MADKYKFNPLTGRLDLVGVTTSTGDASLNSGNATTWNSGFQRVDVGGATIHPTLVTSDDYPFQISSSSPLGHLTSVEISNASDTAETEIQSVDTSNNKYSIKVSAGVIGGLDLGYSDLTTYKGFKITSNSLNVVDTKDGLGLSYLDYLIDEANVDWDTDLSHIPSIGLIKANILSVSIYETDSSLLGNRIVSSDNYKLTFRMENSLDTGVIFIDGNIGTDLNVPLLQFLNPSGSSLVDKNTSIYLGSGIGNDSSNLGSVLTGNGILSPTTSASRIYAYGSSILESATTIGNSSIFIGDTLAPNATTVGSNSIFIGNDMSKNITNIGSYNMLLGQFILSDSPESSLGTANMVLGVSFQHGSLTGSFNIVAGTEAFDNGALSSNFNTILGYSASQNVSTISASTYNTGLGSYVLRDADGSNMSYVTAVGNYSMRYGGGIRTSSFGSNSGHQLLGENNSSLGAFSGRSSDTVFGDNTGTPYVGSGSTFIGHNSGYLPSAASFNNMVIIGSYYGEEADSTVISSTGAIYLTPVTSNGVTTVKFKLPTVLGMPGQVLTDLMGDGVLGWSTTSSANIYNTNDSLTGNRVVTSNSHSLTFELDSSITGKRLDLLRGTLGVSTNVPLLSFRNDGEIDESNLDIFLGANNIPSNPVGNKRIIVGNNNYKGYLIGEESDITIVGNNNFNSCNNLEGANVVVGSNNLNLSPVTESVFIGSDNFIDTTSMGFANVNLGHLNGLGYATVGDYNTFLGSYIAYKPKTGGSIGSFNLFGGLCAYDAVTIGTQNIIMGLANVGQATSISSYNTFIGPVIGWGTLGEMSGSHNTIIGSSAGRSFKNTLNQSTGIGTSSLKFSGGYRLTAVGRSSLVYSDGSSNSALGENSGRPSDLHLTSGNSTYLTGNRNSFFGYNSGYQAANADISDTNVIGSYWATESNTTYISSTGKIVLVPNTALGTSTTLFEFPSSYGTAGQILSDPLGNGVLSWTSLPSIGTTLYTGDGTLSGSDRIVTLDGFTQLDIISNRADFTDTVHRFGSSQLYSYVAENDGASTDRYSYLQVSPTQVYMHSRDQSNGTSGTMYIQNTNAYISLNGTGFSTYTQYSSSQIYSYISNNVAGTSSSLSLQNTGYLSLVGVSSLGTQGIFFNGSGSNGISVSDQATMEGMYYTLDFSANGIANHGDRWVPDYGAVKDYADLVSTINNGEGTTWNDVSKSVDLGGTFTGDVTLTGSNGNDFTFTTILNSFKTIIRSEGNLNTIFTQNTSNTDTTRILNYTNKIVLQVDKGSGGYTGININQGSIQIIDEDTQKGLQVSTDSYALLDWSNDDNYYAPISVIKSNITSSISSTKYITENLIDTISSTATVPLVSGTTYIPSYEGVAQGSGATDVQIDVAGVVTANVEGTYRLVAYINSHATSATSVDIYFRFTFSIIGFSWVQKGATVHKTYNTANESSTTRLEIEVPLEVGNKMRVEVLSSGSNAELVASDPAGSNAFWTTKSECSKLTVEKVVLTPS